MTTDQLYSVGATALILGTSKARVRWAILAAGVTPQGEPSFPLIQGHDLAVLKAVLARQRDPFGHAHDGDEAPSRAPVDVPPVGPSPLADQALPPRGPRVKIAPHHRSKKPVATPRTPLRRRTRPVAAPGPRAAAGVGPWAPPGPPAAEGSHAA